MSAEAPKITMKGDPLTMKGPVPTVGDDLPDATLTANDLSPVKLSDLKGKVLIVATVPSLDTSVCDTEARRFNEEASALGEGVEVLVVSMDLPFAQKRWCAAAGVERVETLSDYQDRELAKATGLLIEELKLLARSVMVVGKDGKIAYVEIVKEVTDEPDYAAALAAAKAAAEK